MLEYESTGGGGGGDRIPLIKFSAMDGSMRTSDRVNENGQWRSVDAEITYPTQFAMDFDNIEMGWITYNPAPDFIMVKAGEPKPDLPQVFDDMGKPMYKWGFRVQLGNPTVGLRELSTTSSNVYNQAMVPLYKAWEAGKAANPGMMPVVEVSGSERVENKRADGSTSAWRIPKWTIAKWVARPDYMTAGVATAPAATTEPVAPLSAPPATTSAGSDLF